MADGPRGLLTRQTPEHNRCSVAVSRDCGDKLRSREGNSPSSAGPAQAKREDAPITWMESCDNQEVGLKRPSWKSAIAHWSSGSAPTM